MEGEERVNWGGKNKKNEKEKEHKGRDTENCLDIRDPGEIKHFIFVIFVSFILYFS